MQFVKRLPWQPWVSVADIDRLKILKLWEHPEIRPEIEVMKTEVMKYQTLPDSIKSIKSFEERKDNKGKGRNGWGGWEDATCMKLPFEYMREAYSGMDLEIDESVTYCNQ